MVSDRRPDETWEDCAERKIREAMEAGEFERLPGMGQPIPGIDRPLDENWWIRDKLRRENVNVLPPVLAVRLEVEKKLEQLHEVPGEPAVRRLVDELNAKIRQASMKSTSGPTTSIAPLNVERILADWRRRRGAASDSSPDTEANP